MENQSQPRSCIICQSNEAAYLFSIPVSVPTVAIFHCPACNLISRSPAVAINNTLPPSNAIGQVLEFAYIDKVLSHSKPAATKLVLVSNQTGATLSAQMKTSRLSITEKCEQDLLGITEPDKFDVAIFSSVIDRSPNPGLLLQKTHQLLRPDGQLIIVGTRISEMLTRQVLRRQNIWQDTINFSFSRSTLQLLLEKHGFGQLLLSSDCGAKGFRAVCTAKKVSLLQSRKVSIIMPVFNEERTFIDIFNQVANKQIEGVDEIEIVIVESKSTDNTRKYVEQVAASFPNVKAIFESEPKGKGHAVREGFKHATGEIILIQDADCEYDVDDYDELVRPLLKFRQPFVLGTRHGGDWKIRQFNGEPALAIVCNLGHIFFAWLMNTFYKQSLADPFTMFKVFRRECLWGLKFECDRFDFDHELLIKLIRKGYRPIEIPVNYHSRSFADGKKINIWRDPITWLKADIKYRFANIFDQHIMGLDKTKTLINSKP